MNYRSPEYDSTSTPRYRLYLDNFSTHMFTAFLPGFQHRLVIFYTCPSFERTISYTTSTKQVSIMSIMSERRSVQRFPCLALVQVYAVSMGLVDAVVGVAQQLNPVVQARF